MGFYWVSLGQNGFQWVLLGFFWFFFVGVLLDVSGRCDGIIKEAALAFALANTGRIEASSPPFNEPVGFFSFSFYFFFCFFFLFFMAGIFFGKGAALLRLRSSHDCIHGVGSDRFDWTTFPFKVFFCFFTHFYLVFFFYRVLLGLHCVLLPNFFTEL